MSLGFEVAGYEIRDNALLPSVRVRLRVTNQTSKVFVAGVIICAIHFGKIRNLKLPYITTATSLSNAYVGIGNSFDVQIDILFTQEILYRLDKLIVSSEDVRLMLYPDVQIFYVDQQSKIEQVAHYAGECNFEIKMSDWAKIAYEWGKEMVLVPMSPKIFEKVKELLKTNRHLKSPADVIDELLNLYTKQQG